MAEVFSAPSKVFLLGEYAALAGAPALVAATAPRFRLSAGAGAVSGPAEKLRAVVPRAPELRFEDPHQGRGGLGASSAQFALTYRALAEFAGWDLSWQGAYRAFRELTAGEPRPPSGADVVAQWRGGITVFSREGEPRAERLDDAFPWSRVLVFSATGQPGRKVATHEHLRDVREIPVDRLAPALESGLRSARAGDAAGFGSALTAYAEALASLGWECPAAAADRAALARVPGVLGVKGSGALLADAVVAVIEERARAGVAAAAAARGLELIGSLRSDEEGVVPA